MRSSAAGRAAAVAIGVCALALASSAHAQAAINCAGELYAISQVGNLFRVDTASGVAAALGTAPSSLTEVEYDPASGELWAADGGTGTMLRRLDPASGAQIAAVALNPAGPITGLEFVGNTLYGTRIAASGFGPNPSSLVTIDRASGVVTTIGATGLSEPVSGLAYDKANAIMYGVVAGSTALSMLVRIDLATGAATTIGTSTGFSKIGGLEFGGDGTLYAGVAGAFTNSGALLRINATTGIATLVGSTGFLVSGLTACAPGAPRTFVSVEGNDANPCSAAAPCRTLSHAITQTLVRGEIQILDSGGYGGLTVDRSIAIAASEGVYAGVTVSSGTGIVVDAGPSAVVTLRGLTINGLGGTRGVDVQSAAALFVDRCTMSAFAQEGIRALPAQAASLYVQDSALRDNGTGIVAGTTAAGMLSLLVDRTRFENNANGLQIVQRGAIGTVRRSRFVGGTFALAVSPTTAAGASIDVYKSAFEGASAGVGIAVGGNPGAPARASVAGSLFSHNGTGVAVAADGVAYIGSSTITRNNVGVVLGGNGAAVSFGDNRLLENVADGAFSSTIPTQ